MMVGGQAVICQTAKEGRSKILLIQFGEMVPPNCLYCASMCPTIDWNPIQSLLVLCPEFLG